MRDDKTKVLVMVPCREQDYDAYQLSAPEFEYFFTNAPTDGQLAEAEIIIGQPRIEQLRKATSLKWLQITYAGADYYTNSDYFPDHVTLTNVSGAFGQAISEYVLSMVLMLMKKLHLYRDNQLDCRWKDCGEEASLDGKTVLIIGAGDIGCEVAKFMKLFGCRNIGIRRVLRSKPDNFDEMYSLQELDMLLPQADVVILTLPVTRETVNVMNRDRIYRMKQDAILVNVGRGILVDTDALAEALLKEQIGGAALDVTAPEPLPEDHKLWKCKNAIITPHITGASFGHLKQTRDKIMAIITDNIKRYATGQELMNIVDFETGYRTTQF